MKTIQQTFLAIFFGILLVSNISIAQEDKQYLISSTTLHLNINNENFSIEEWKTVEKEYLEKVVKKNPFIVGQEFLTHYLTADNTEVIVVTTYESWSDIEKANAIEKDLIKAAWPDETVRTAFFEKRDNYYAHNHSVEIHSAFPGAKAPKAYFDKPMLYYIRESVFAYPKDGNQNEFIDLRNQYVNAVILKNDYIKAYYPNVPVMGSDNTKFNEVFVVESLDDVGKALDKNIELFKATWNTDEKAKEFNKKAEKYFTGSHGDYIYRLVPELTK